MVCGCCVNAWRSGSSHGHALADETTCWNAALCCPSPDALIDVDAPELMLPGNMIGKINAQLKRAGHRAFAADDEDIPLIANTIFHSLAARYAEVLSSIATLTRKKLKRLFIVGGGSQNTFLNRLTAERTGP